MKLVVIHFSFHGSDVSVNSMTGRGPDCRERMANWRRFFSAHVQTGFRFNPAFYPVSTEGSLPGGKDAKLHMTLTNHLCLMQRFRMRGSIRSLENSS